MMRSKELLLFILLSTGVVLVVSQFVPRTDTSMNIEDEVGKVVDKCGTEGECLTEGFKEVLGRFPSQQIAHSLNDFGFSCHTFNHYLGRALYERLGTLGEAYGSCEFVCFHGCFHGVFEAYLQDTDNDLIDFSGASLSELCEGLQNSGSKPEEQLRRECFHGLGHGLMLLTNANLQESLSLCDRLPGQWQRERCYGGTFMENVVSFTNPHRRATSPKSDDPHYPCSKLDSRYRPLCYLYQPSYLLFAVPFDVPAAFELCRKMPQEYQQYCFFGIGEFANWRTLEDVGTAQQICSFGRGEEERYCAIGAADSIMRYSAGDSLDETFTFCQSMAGDVRVSCLRTLRREARAWGVSQEKLEEVCAPLEPENRQWCISGSFTFQEL